MKQRTGYRTLRGALLVSAAAGLLISGQAYAQETGQTEPTSQELEELVVVGSRIRRDTFNAPSPIQVITREESTLAGLTSAADLLQGTAVTGGTAQINNAFGGFVTNGGPGANTLSLRGLGAGRTLVLINGRRVAPAGTRGAVGSADLNVLPNAMIERVEVLRDGASSIYGSDAIAGVVNVVTRSDIEGVTVEGQYNRPFNEGGEQGRFSIVGGASGDRWKVAGSFEFYEREELTLADRDWTRCNTDYLFDPTTGESADYIDPLTGRPKCYPISSTGSNGVTINTLGTASMAGVAAPGAVLADGTIPTVFNRWRPNAAITTGDLPGFEGVGGPGGIDLNVRDTFDPRMLNESLISPVQVYTAFGQASYEFEALGNAEVYAEFLGNKRDSQQTGYRQLSLDYAVGSPLLPESMQDLAPFLGPQPITNGQNVAARAFIGFGNDKSEQSVEYYKGTAGVRGDLTFLPDWRYDANVSYARSDAKYMFEQFLIDRLSESLDVVAAPAGLDASLIRRAADGSSITCRVNTTNPARGCVAAPVLNTQTLAGQLPEDWVDYVFRPVIGTTVYDEWNASASVDGPLVDLPAGEAMGAFGVEFRRSEINDTPGEDMINANLYNFSTATPTRGDDSVIEAFGEVEVPLLANLPFIKELTVNGSARYTEYDSYGSDWTYKAGGVYRPLEWLSFRASYGTSYRAPALFEQFQGATSGFLSQQGDPCNNYGGPNVNPNRAANCAAELPGQPDFQQTQSIRVFSQGGAAQGLEAETSDNLTLGVILQPELPEAFGEFAFAVDYYDIKVENGVSRVGSAALLSLCYNDPAFRSGGGYCRFIERDENNALTVFDAYTNIATQIVTGVDYSMRWTRDIGPGNFRFNAQLSQYLEQKDKLFPDDPYDNYNGTIGNPRWTGTFDASYRYAEWTFRYGVDWIDGMDSTTYLEVDPAADPYVFKVDDYFEHYLSVQYAEEDWSVTAGVRNLFDKEPPQISMGYYNRVGNAPLYSGYDYVGRELFVTLSKSF
ncbi:TonB-dependent receptor domain-containing protein [Indioceanicola profundi]|uniref:TonB-dependent receptor domain-containing protein n=1 Tax=Indioceanicola profundi TaxID=2220096 RepID=UPI000E6ADA37|nr:TonB-dependent receptor [Indioceanicola profundi]